MFNMKRRLTTCFLLRLSLLWVLTGQRSSQEQFLTYDNATGWLHFSCPRESDMINKTLILATFGRYIQQTAGPQKDRIAKLFDHTVTMFDRRAVSDNNTRHHTLTGFLQDVRCADSQTYYCSYHYSEHNKSAEERLELFTFTFEGTPFVSIETPRKTGHGAGATIKLKCRALLGRQNDSIVWETRARDEQVFADTKSDSNHTVPIDTKNCNYYAESTLSHVLTADDDERAWRCRLTYGRATDDVIIIVDDSKEACSKADGENDTKQELTSVHPNPECCSEQAKEISWDKAIFILVVVSLLIGAVIISKNFFRNRCTSSKILNESVVFLVSSAHQDTSDERPPADPELRLTPDEVDADDGYANVSVDESDLPPETSDLEDNQDVVSGQASAGLPPPFEPGFSQLGGDTEGYDRLGRHGNSNKAVNSVSPAGLNYQHLCPYYVLETLVSDGCSSVTSVGTSVNVE